MKETKEQVMKNIMRAILIHCNGWSYEDADNAAGENKGHPVYCEIEEIIDDIILYGIEDE